MKIGIDISQLAYGNTGVSNYLKQLVTEILRQDSRNKYVLFYSSLRKSLDEDIFSGLEKDKFEIRRFFFPQSLLVFLWNKLHILPIEFFVGDVDIFISSDWTEPPAKKCKKATIIYDLIVYKYPEETDKKIIDVQKRKLSFVKKESDMIFCISDSTLNDVREILGITRNRLFRIYPSVSI